MNTKELIAKLQAIDPTGEAEVEIPVQTRNKVYPVAYIKPELIERGGIGDNVRIYCWLPDGMHTVKRAA